MAKQRQAKKKLGFLSSASFKELAKAVTAFHRGMKDAGFVEDKNVKVTYQWANHDLERLPELAHKLVESGVDVIAATGGIAAAQAAVNATRNASATKQVRVVFVCGSNPVEANGNVTGVTTSTAESLPDRLKLLEKMVNNKKVVALLTNPTSVFARQETQKGGAAPILEASSDAELKQRFAEAKQRGYAVLVGADAFFTCKRDRIIALARQSKVPTAYAFREYVDADGLMSYGPSLTNAYRQAGLYVGKIFGGETEVDLPVLKPNCCELVINLKTAKALKIDVPLELLARADHVVR
jgi:putative tryptophan/tyrosine transport system substrate-binding protein